MSVNWLPVVITVLALFSIGGYVADIGGVQEELAMWEGPHWWQHTATTATVNTTTQTTFTMVVDGEDVITTTKPNDNKYSLGEDGKYRLRTDGDQGNPNQDTLVDPPTLKVVDVQEKSVWIDSDGTALPEVIKVGSQVLYLQANAMNTEFGAIVLQSLIDSDDKFQKAFQSAKEESFSTYLRNSEGIWGDVAGKWVDENNKYVAFLVKISTGKYGIWYTTPDTTSGNIPSSKDDLKTITPYVAEPAPAKNQPEPTPETKSETKSEKPPAAGGYKPTGWG